MKLEAGDTSNSISLNCMLAARDKRMLSYSCFPRTGGRHLGHVCFACVASMATHSSPSRHCRRRPATTGRCCRSAVDEAGETHWWSTTTPTEEYVHLPPKRPVTTLCLFCWAKTQARRKPAIAVRSQCTVRYVQ